ncbi:hypothetical protein WMY93_003006 [Mugilogobius chulae]|uniref:Fas-binding factor 1 C-terminal domain-containing protein n=1 Tax=Mugilogobius chulae TaxID=88201 RepID=A0AAW0Q3Q0_9GOBI
MISNRNLPTNRSSAADNIFSMLAEEVKQDDADSENSDISEADPIDMLKNMKDLDDMEADLFVLKKKPSSAPAKSTGKDEAKKNATAVENNEKPGGGDKSSINHKKPNSAPASGRNYKNLTFSDDDGGEGEPTQVGTEDVDDPLDDLLPDEPKLKPKNVVKSVPSAPISPILKNKISTKKHSDLLFDDSKDDLMDALGFDGDQSSKKKNIKEMSDQPQRARTKVDDILQSLTSPHLLERPPTGEKKELLQDKSSILKEKQDDDLTFGSYQPTVSVPEGRQSRRQSVRFSTEDVSISNLDKKTKPSTPTRQRASADWLGLKSNDDHVEDHGDQSKSEKASSNPPLGAPLERRASVSGPPQLPSIFDHKIENITCGRRRHSTTDCPYTLRRRHSSLRDRLFVRSEADTADSGTLRDEREGKERESSRRKHTQVRKSVKIFTPSSVEQRAYLSITEKATSAVTARCVSRMYIKQVTSHTSMIREDPALSVRELRTSPSETGPAAHSTSIREETTKQGDRTIKDFQSTPAPVQPQRSRARTVQPFGDHQSLQAHMLQLEGQMKRLQMERDQSQLLLENIQLRQKHDMELLENAHKARVKLLEDSAAQRETRLRQECEDWMERLAALTRSTEQEAPSCRHSTSANWKSILEMKKDHEDQIHRLKKLKDEEIDAVTSATSQTRSLSVVIEQMEQFSSRLGELSCRVESTHENTAHGLEQGARHRDEQLRVRHTLLQDRLAQQQKAMSEEKAYLKEIISRMDTQINEQQRQLEKERWKVTSEQAKAESTQRALEDERRSLSMQMSMEREELERAKSALLEEQKSVMQHCTEERRKLAAEWASFHAQEKQRHDRTEREVSSLLEKREGSIISMAQIAADKFEEGERALHEAKVVEAEHEARLRHIHSQTEKLRQHEQRILQERMQLTGLQKEQAKQTIPNLTPLLPSSKLAPTLNILPNLCANSQSMALQASLALWKYTAEKDREFLEDEKAFLENLKKKSYNASFLD